VTRHEEVVAAAVAEQERRDRDALGRPLNPDTNLPYPTASQAQLELAEELLDRLDDDDTLTVTDSDLDKIRDALVEAVVRQHGRTLRACIAEVRAVADDLDRDARILADDSFGSAGARPNPASLSSAARLAGAGASMRALLLRGHRA
jgi:hypothetical protein